MKRLMLLDDEPNVLQSLLRSLRSLARENNLTIEIHTDAKDAIQRLNEASFELIVSDYHMPSMSGVDFLKLARAIQPDAIRLMLSASADFKTLLEAVNEAEIFRYIEKPWNGPDLEDIVRLALAQRDHILSERQLADESRQLKGELSPQELEAKRLEQDEPGITRVKWGPDGSVLLD